MSVRRAQRETNWYEVQEWYCLRRIRHDRRDFWCDILHMDLQRVAGLPQKSLLPRLKTAPLSEKAMQARMRAMAACRRADEKAARDRLEAKKRKREERRGKNANSRPTRR